MFLITGATGFIGKSTTVALLAMGQPVVAAVRRLPEQSQWQYDNLQWQEVGNINNQTEWQSTLQGVSVVVHCAARAHINAEQDTDLLNTYRELNVEGTLRLAQQAIAAGVQRFIFLSSIKVNGGHTLPGQPFNEQASYAPQDVYSQTKAEAEQALLTLATETSLEIVIIRSPLVYGPGVKGNFATMIKAVQSGLPLPLGRVHNHRSLVALENLVSLIVLCADRVRSPAAANQVFVVADGEDVSTTSLLQKIAEANSLPSRLLPVPICLLRAMASLLRRSSDAKRLIENLQIDAAKVHTLLGWQPVVSMDQQLSAMFKKDTSITRQGFILLRGFDILIAGTGLLVLSPLLLLVFAFCWFDTGMPLFTQERVGRYQRPFVLVKFRTMIPGTVSVASHMAKSTSITRFGSLLRRTKLDELPQLWNVLLGDMSLVGPRPSLFNQHELIKARTANSVYAARPGITGLAQISGIDMSTPELLAKTDAQMLKELNLINYFKFILLTFFGKGFGDGVK
jgi:lipopolysaccharide/colanic/teichoic acid biosynthesis glycosyltransferase/dTDP-4-dehydrorhamnose reductase